jgi:hypothetical protein
LLRSELLRRADLDQAARNGRDPDAMARVDGENLPWLRRINGSPGVPDLAEYLAAFAEQDEPPASTRCPACRGLVEFWPPEPGERVSADCADCGRTLT